MSCLHKTQVPILSKSTDLAPQVLLFSNPWNTETQDFSHPLGKEPKGQFSILFSPSRYSTRSDRLYLFSEKEYRDSEEASRQIYSFNLINQLGFGDLSKMGGKQKTWSLEREDWRRVNMNLTVKEGTDGVSPVHFPVRNQNYSYPDSGVVHAEWMDLARYRVNLPAEARPGHLILQQPPANGKGVDLDDNHPELEEALQELSLISTRQLSSGMRRLLRL